MARKIRTRPTKAELLRSGLRKLERGGQAPTRAELAALDVAEAAHDRAKEREWARHDAREAELAKIAERGAPALELVVHRTNGVMELVQKKRGRWAARMLESEVVEDVAAEDCRALASKPQAQELLARLQAPSRPRRLPTEKERRERLKAIAGLDFLDVEGLVEAYRHFAALAAAGEGLGSMERRPFLMIRAHFVRELAAALERPVQALERELVRG